MIKLLSAAFVSTGKDRARDRRAGNEEVMYIFHYVGHGEMREGY